MLGNGAESCYIACIMTPANRLRRRGKNQRLRTSRRQDAYVKRRSESKPCFYFPMSGRKTPPQYVN